MVDETTASNFDVGREAARLARVGALYSGAVGRERLPDMEDHHKLRGLERLESRLISEGRWAAGPKTLFGALKLAHHEVANCRVLAWLLDPLAPHGLGAAVLRSFLTYLNTTVEEAVVVSSVGVERAVVVTEEARERSRADLVVYAPGWTVVVEAKLGAGEGHEQGQRLAEDWPDAVYVFLTRMGRPMRSAGDSIWLPMTWGDMLALVRQALADAGESTTAAMDTARAGVRDYLIATGHMGS